MARLGTEERFELALTRLQRVLAASTVASMRTLEMKISDGGPFNQRIDPHILTDARTSLVNDGLIQVVDGKGLGKWYHLTDAPVGLVEERLATLTDVQGEYSTRNFNMRLGQTLEIASSRSLLRTDYQFFGRFPDLDQHRDDQLYEKEEPPGYIGARHIPGNRRLDFLVHLPHGWAGLECKNIREWIYPDRREIRELIDKCLYLDCIPVLIARRIHISTFFVLSKCGLIIHQNYNQLLPEADIALAEKAKDKTLLGYHDIKLGNEPDARLCKFLEINLPGLIPSMRDRWDAYRDLLEGYARHRINYSEFAARVRRRHNGTNEDGDWE